MKTSSALRVLLAIGVTTQPALSLDNGLRVPPMGWSSWYGFTQNVNETMLRDMADGMVSSGLHAVGFSNIWLDDGWAIGRDNKTGHVIVDPVLFPSGMRNISDHCHDRGLKFGIYTSKGPLTCLGYQPTQPKRPGSCGFEQIDADVYVHEWDVDQVKDDGCGQCPQHEPFAAMRDALNKTGKPVWYAIHSSTATGSPNATVANMWRTGGDLSSSSFDMWTNRLDLATTASQRALAGPGAFPNPDFLEVGYSPRMSKERSMSLVEQRSMFTMWAALPGPLILSADLRPGRAGLDNDVLRILLNKEVIAVNQDERAASMEPIVNSDGLQVWRKPLSTGFAVVLFNRNASSHAVAGQAVYSSSAACAAWSMLDGGVRLRNNTNNTALCMGQISTCECSNPPSPRIGLVECNADDLTQHWTYNATTKQINNDAKHDLNSGPICPGEEENSMLLYPAQGRPNEMFSYNEATGVITTGGRCLAHTVAPISREISVTWQELGLPPTQAVAVRDLWNQTDLGEHEGSFKVLVGYHEARIFTFTPSTK
eukprot:m.23863 g.23863  ORF g.23863 m.23863 type:complete len:539 (+) comp14384_c0_seq1:136-1752(+)